MTFAEWLKRVLRHSEDVSIPTVSGPPGHPALIPGPRRPKVRGLSKEARVEVLATYRLAMRERTAAIASFNRRRMISHGITEYIWVAGVPELCSVARKNNGKRFSCLIPPADGHVGEGTCDADWCRCIAKSVVPGFN